MKVSTRDKENNFQRINLQTPQDPSKCLSARPKPILKNVQFQDYNPKSQTPIEYKSTKTQNKLSYTDNTPSRQRNLLKSPSGLVHDFNTICKTPSEDFSRVLQTYGMKEETTSSSRKPKASRKIQFEEDGLKENGSNVNNSNFKEMNNQNEFVYEPSEFVRKIFQEFNL